MYQFQHVGPFGGDAEDRRLEAPVPPAYLGLPFPGEWRHLPHPIDFTADCFGVLHFQRGGNGRAHTANLGLVSGPAGPDHHILQAEHANAFHDALPGTHPGRGHHGEDRNAHHDTQPS